MSDREDFLAANAKGELLEAVGKWPYGDYDSLGALLAELHNSGEVDVLSKCSSDELSKVSGSSLVRLRDVFCKVLPRLECRVEEAMKVCQVLHEKSAKDDLLAGEVYVALERWLHKDTARIENALALVKRKNDVQAGVTRAILTAGATHDAEKYAKEALELSQNSQEGIRIDSLKVLGNLRVQSDHRLVPLILQRLDEVIDNPLFDAEVGIAVQSALRLLIVLDDAVINLVEPLVIEACGKPNPITLQVLAAELSLHGEHFTTAMRAGAFEAFKSVMKSDVRTTQSIDRVLYKWDLDDDRVRVLDLLKSLIGRKDNAIHIEELEFFRAKLKESPGDVRAWYILSLLLTGNHRLCYAASRLMPFEGVPDGIGIDLAPFSLDGRWVLFLAKKILAYFQINPASDSTLLLSCLRAVPSESLAELEDLIFEFFLINFPGAIRHLQSNLSETDLARPSVNRLARRLKKYLKSLQEAGDCDAFRPSERERLLQSDHQNETWVTQLKKAERQSVVSQVFPKVTVLYGASVITYSYPRHGMAPVRKELPLTSHNLSREMPRFEFIDPIGWQYVKWRFRSEAPPK